MIDFWQEIYGTIKRNKLRTFLTGFSVAWGIFILIILLGAGNGLIHTFEQDSANRMLNSMRIFPGNTSKAFEGFSIGRDIQFKNYDLGILERNFKDNIIKAGATISSGSMSNTFNDGTTIATVADMNDMIFDGNIDETEVGLLHEGMPLKLTIGALQNLTFDASLEYISPKATKQNGANQFEIKAAVKVNNAQIRSGYSANATVTLEKALKVVSVPEGAVDFSTKTPCVYVMTDSVPSQKFRKQTVTTGMSDGINIEIKSGLKAGDRVRGDVISKDNNNNNNK